MNKIMDKNNSYEENEKGFELTEHSINIWMKKFKRTSSLVYFLQGKKWLLCWDRKKTLKNCFSLLGLFDFRPMDNIFLVYNYSMN